MPKREPKPKGRPKKTPREMAVVSIKMTTEFRDWLTRGAQSERMTTVQLLERSVVAYLKQAGFPETAPQRTEGR